MREIMVTATTVRRLTTSYVQVAVLEYKCKHPERGSFTMPDVIPTEWPAELMPLWGLYQNGKVAGQQLGKVVAQVAATMGLESKLEARFGKKDAITRYFF